jgi:hypothetical protein
LSPIRAEMDELRACSADMFTIRRSVGPSTGSGVRTTTARHVPVEQGEQVALAGR